MMYYCYVEPGSTFENGQRDIGMHISTAKWGGGYREPDGTYSTADEIKALAEAENVDWYMIYISGYPRRAVKVEKADKWLSKLERAAKVKPAGTPR